MTTYGPINPAELECYACGLDLDECQCEVCDVCEVKGDIACYAGGVNLNHGLSLADTLANNIDREATLFVLTEQWA